MKPPTPDLAITPTPPYSWRQTVAALEGWRACVDRGRATVDGARWLLALPPPEPGPNLVVDIAPGPSGDLEVRLHGATPTGALLEHARREVTWRLALDLATAELHERAAADPPFAPVAALLSGFHPPLYPTAFQAACWTVIRQRTPPAFAAATAERVAALLGQVVEAPDGGEGLRLFPTPQALDDTARPALLAATNNLRKVERLRGLADAFATVDEGWLRQAPYDEACEWLGGLPGVGPWSAEQIMWRGLGRYERVPWRDTGAILAVGAVYTAGLTPAKGTARELAERYGWLQGLWLRYLKAYPRVAP